MLGRENAKSEYNKVTTGPEVKIETETKEIKGITEDDLRVVIPEKDASIIVLQCNARDERDPDSKIFGTITPEGILKARKKAQDFFKTFITSIPEDERKDIDILVLASNATLDSPEGFMSEHKRASETAEATMDGICEALKEAGLSLNQLLNFSEFKQDTEPNGVIEFEELEDTQIFRETPEFVQHLVSKHGSKENFWIQYEQDTDKKTRQRMKAEGVDDIASRMGSFMRLLAQASQERHKNDNGKRLVIWTVSHYDAISPFIKRRVLDRPATDYLPINKTGGITMEVTQGGEVVTQIHNQKFNVDL